MRLIAIFITTLSAGALFAGSVMAEAPAGQTCRGGSKHGGCTFFHDQINQDFGDADYAGSGRRCG